MVDLTVNNKLAIMKDVAMFECTCTEAQELGTDPTFCTSCSASAALNRIDSIIAGEFEEL